MNILIRIFCLYLLIFLLSIFINTIIEGCLISNNVFRGFLRSWPIFTFYWLIHSIYSRANDHEDNKEQDDITDESTASLNESLALSSLLFIFNDLFVSFQELLCSNLINIDQNIHKFLLFQFLKWNLRLSYWLFNQLIIRILNLVLILIFCSSFIFGIKNLRFYFFGFNNLSFIYQNRSYRGN